jgi:cation diffusion facilitator family transporter
LVQDKAKLMSIQKSNFRTQLVILSFGLVLFVIKVVAWYLTQSVAILSDALEGIINITTGGFGLYALYLATIPKDSNHPYGHGKAEFVTAGIEGLLIGMAGLGIVYKGVLSLIHPEPLAHLDWGIVLISIAGIANYILGWISAKKGKANRSLALESTGKHLISDAYTTVGISIALIVVYYTQATWIDGVASIVLAFILMFMGYKIIRKSLSGVMDEADEELVTEIKQLLHDKSEPEWKRFKGIRVIRSGSNIHIDGIVYLPAEMPVREAEICLVNIHEILVEKYGEFTETAFIVRAEK